VPELPEVETLRRQLEPELVGRTIEGVDVLDPKWGRLGRPGAVQRVCAGRRIEAVDRRGKFMLVELDDDWTLILHLRMTGNLRFIDPAVETRHLRVAFRLDDGRTLGFVDARRLGHGEVIRSRHLGKRLGGLGIEPLSEDFTPEALCRMVAGRKAPLKSFLLYQGGVAGVGNIYADEALHRARLHPLTPANSLRPEHCQALHAGIVEALEAGLRNQGASIDTYRDSRGRRGSMQDKFLVHRREGKPCPRGDDVVRRIVVGGRSTYFCPKCQVRLKAPRPKRAPAGGP
jgi:formamidopyrimidine-DNA glycosylase